MHMHVVERALRAGDQFNYIYEKRMGQFFEKNKELGRYLLTSLWKREMEKKRNFLLTGSSGSAEGAGTRTTS